MCVHEELTVASRNAVVGVTQHTRLEVTNGNLQALIVAYDSLLNEIDLFCSSCELEAKGQERDFLKFLCDYVDEFMSKFIEERKKMRVLLNGVSLS